MKRSHSPVAGFLALAALAAVTFGILSGGNRAVSKEAEAKAKAKSKVTYAKEVSRIMQENCQVCHHAGTAAPFSLMTYDDVVKQAENIKDAVTDKRMPPWFADPHYGKFSNDRRLKPADVDALVSWVDGGLEKGNPADLPAERTFADGWVIGKPDVIFKLPEAQKIPASGTVPYEYFTTPTNFKEDMWVTAAEARPGNRAVVHHIIVSYRDPKNKERSGRGNGGGIGDGFLVGTAPGDMPLILRPGVARRIPAGAELIWQMHYTPNGKEATDLSEVGIIFYKGKEPPQYNSQTVGITNANFVIPPGESNHKVESEWTAPRDTLLLGFMPHMHLRGKDFQYQVKYPDGKTETLLSVPHYDFNWQLAYREQEPLLLPKGTTIHCTAHFDNSKANKANPDPTKEVTWGDQTWEEMMIGWIDYVWKQPESEAVKEGFTAF
jgi:mono/diheme cytochrome c family protein